MTVMIDSFFGIHPFVVRFGLWAKMMPSERSLYVYLMERSEFYCSREFQAKDSDLRASVGVSGRAACNARKKLQEYGLIRYKAGLGNRYTYTICDPKTKQQYLGDPKVPLAMPKRLRSDADETPTASLRQEPQKASAPALSYGLKLDFNS